MPSSGLWRSPRAEPGRAERLALPAVAQYQVNAGWLVYVQPQLSALTACRMPWLACAPIAAELAPGDLFHWSLGPRSLYVRRREGGRDVLQRIDLATGKAVDAVTLPPGGFTGTLTVSPDESTLIVAREEGPAVDLMLAK